MMSEVSGHKKGNEICYLCGNNLKATKPARIFPPSLQLAYLMIPLALFGRERGKENRTVRKAFKSPSKFRMVRKILIISSSLLSQTKPYVITFLDCSALAYNIMYVSYFSFFLYQKFIVP